MKHYSFNVTQHAKDRWKERFGLPVENMLDRLERTKSIGRGLRKSLIDSSKSDQHRKMLNKVVGTFTE